MKEDGGLKADIRGQETEVVGHPGEMRYAVLRN